MKAQAAADDKAAANQVIQAGELQDANPWLRRTRWARYLAEVHPQDLLDVVATPGVDEIDETSQATRVIWDTMEQLARRSQQTVQHCGSGIRMAAICTMPGQTPHTPLQAYMDEKSIQDHVRPWQQILIFITRTQTRWLWQGKEPRYIMTSRQRKTWQRLWQAAMQVVHGTVASPVPDDGRASPDPMDPAEEGSGFRVRVAGFRMTRVETACLEFCIELLNQKIQVHEYESALVCSMAVLGRGVKTWLDPDSYPPIISRVLKVARFMVVQKALWLDPQPMGIIEMWAGQAEQGSWAGDAADHDLGMIMEDEGFAEGAAEGPIPSSPPSSIHSQDAAPISRMSRHGRMPFQTGVDVMVGKFMVRGQHGPVEVLLDWRTYGLKVHYNTTAPGHVTWMGTERLLYKNLDFTMGQFRGMVHGLVQAARGLLGGLLCEPEPRQWPAIPWDGLFDNPSEATPGWSFLSDQRTQWPVPGRHWLIDRIAQEPGVARTFVTQGGLSASKTMKYFQQVARFKEKLAVAVHLTSGAPARAPELLSVQHVNTDTNVRRNIYIEDGMVVLVSAYHKGFYSSNDVKIIHRYLPRAVGELVIWYLWLVLPFLRQLAVSWGRMGEPGMERQPHHRSPYLWGPDVGSGRAWTSERFREALKQASQTGLGLGSGFNVANYRDIAVGISRRFLRGSSAFPDNIQAERQQELAAIHTDHDPEDGIGDIADEQAGHSSHVAGMVYGRDSMEFTGSTTMRRLKFRASSMDWHQFLGFTTEAATVLGKRVNPWEAQAADHQVQRREQLQATHMEQALQRMTGRGEIRFRGVQQPAMQAIQDGASPVVAVMPTGGGKSVLFMLPAFVAPGGCTIVVVPLISLRADLMQRCQQLGIRCVSWESRRPPDEAAIVLVTPESSEDPDFHTFLNRQRWMRRLDRIVVDECHIILNSQKDFRPAMARLGRLVSARTQMVFLTATLPPSMERIFVQRIQHPASAVGMYRARTSRGNVAYRVWRPILPRQTPREPHQWLVTPGVVQYIQGRIQQARGGRVIVYGQTKSQVQAISREFGCEAYHSEAVDRAGVMQRFQDGLHRVIAATSALGMGIDIPDIRCVIHVGRPRTLLEYGQESGRAGRDGQDSEAVIIHPDGWETPDPWIHGVADADFQLVQAYMGHGCRRYILDGYLDGTVDGYTRERCRDQGPDELACDGCDPDWEVQEEPVSMASSPPGSGSGSGFSRFGRAPESGFEGSGQGDPELGLPNDAVRSSGAQIHTGLGFIPHYASSSSDTGENPDHPRAMSIDSGESITSQVPRARVIPASAGYTPQERQYEQAAVQQQAQAMQAGIDEEFIEQEARQWLDQCYICTVRGRDGDHQLEQCTHAESHAAQEWLGQVQRRVDYVPFRCCYQCGMPQAICHGWQHGEACTWRGALLPMIAGMVYGPFRRMVQPAWEQWLQPRQLEGRVIYAGKIFQQEIVAGPVPAGDYRSVAAFFGQGTVDRQGVEVQAVFCWLRRVCHDIEAGLI
ncbi:RecQ family DEAD/DEAH box helicase [Salinispora arenicola]|nr:RecQ family DEAD/DEAH box helicase [Salinispora arenicola]